MTDRVRSMIKKSGSRAGKSRSSMSHLGTTACKYKVDIFVSHIDGIKTADEVCLVWDRRGKIISTSMVKVKDSKATFRETLSMETTLFRRASHGVKVGAAPVAGEELKFDEKKAKIALRKGSPQGKALGKIVLNLSEYIKGLTSTLFADLKLSNGSVVSAKIEATFLQVGKKKKGEDDDDAASDAGSEMTDVGMDNDSIFGDDANDMADIDIMVQREESASSGSPREKKDPVANSSPVSDAGGKVRRSASVRAPKSKTSSSLVESPSARTRTKSRVKNKELERATTKSRSRSFRTDEAAELRKAIETLRTENAKLKSAKSAAMEEIEALREELSQVGEGGSSTPKSRESLELRMLKKEMERMTKETEELKGQNKNLLVEIEEIHEEEVKSQKAGAGKDSQKLKGKIQDLEIALRREPKFMDVVNELKVAKVSLALANMEKEQALFELQQYTGGPKTIG